MIELYRTTAESPLADEVEQTLADLIVSHRVHVVGSRAEAPGGVVPTVVEGKRTVTPDELPAYLAVLAQDVSQWRRFQSDVCYVDDDGSVC